MRINPLLGLCRLGLHNWPRVHGDWREPVMEPTKASCTRCSKQLKSIWRTAYPKNGSKCRPGACETHVQASAAHQADLGEKAANGMEKWTLGRLAVPVVRGLGRRL